jgi:hypothetical protein
MRVTIHGPHCLLLFPLFLIAKCSRSKDPGIAPSFAHYSVGRSVTLFASMCVNSVRYRVSCIWLERWSYVSDM